MLPFPLMIQTFSPFLFKKHVQLLRSRARSPLFFCFVLVFPAKQAGPASKCGATVLPGRAESEETSLGSTSPGNVGNFSDFVDPLALKKGHLARGQKDANPNGDQNGSIVYFPFTRVF